jgi:ATP/ADP translocase
MPLEPSERSAVAAATAGVFLLIAEQVASRAVRDTLFLTAFQVRSLPFMMMASAVVALASARTVSAALTRRSPHQVVPAMAFASAAILLALLAAAPVLPRATALLLYLHVAAFGGALVSGFWSLVNERFDPYSARRVMGRVGTGATAGGVAGGVVTWLASKLLPVAAMILVLALLHAAAGLVLRRFAGEPRPVRSAASGSARIPTIQLLAVPFLRQIVLFALLGAVVESIVDFLFKAEAQARFEGGAALLSVLALFHTGMSVASFLLQAGGARAALAHLGIAGTAALRPLLTAVSAGAGVIVPGFPVALAARSSHEALTNSLYRSAYELMFTPLPESEKRRAKALIDVGIDKAGTLAGSALVTALVWLLPLGSQRTLFGVASLLSLGALALARPLHRGYVRTLERSLLDGRVRLDPTEVVDPATRLTLAQTGHMDRDTLLRQIEAMRASSSLPSLALAPTLTSGLSDPAIAEDASPAAPPPPRDPEEELAAALRGLRSREPAAVRSALRRLPELPPLLVAAAVPLLAVDDCFPDVLRALRRAAPRVTGQLVDVLLDRDADPLVRRRIARVLKGCSTARSAEGLAAALDDPSFEVRAAAGAALAALHEHSGVVRVERESVLERVRRELDSGETVDRQLPQLFALLSLALERQPLLIAWAAMKTDDKALRGTALEYLSNVLPDDVFTRLRSCFGASLVWAPRAARRPAAAVADELLASSVSLHLERPPWRNRGER